MRQTKIVATLGPACESPEQVLRLIDAGMNVARLNFSHGGHEEHAARIATVRAASEKSGKPVAILQDLSGPKIRTQSLAGGKPVLLAAGQTLTITTDEIEGTADHVSTTYENLPDDVVPGDCILISDGLIELKVLKKGRKEITCQVLNDAELRENQGINLPGIAISAPTITQKDIEDLNFGLAHGVDYVAISFVRRASDVLQVKNMIAAARKSVPVIAKIERPEALAVLNDILDVADGVMVARGDLGVEIPLEQVPIIQKRIIAAANRRAVPVITATQMLESMIHNPNPTRAEVSDVANAIIDGSDAVMLSGETSIGAYPVDAVRTMAEIATAVEEGGYGRSEDDDMPAYLLHEVTTTPQAIGAAVSAITNALQVDAIWVFTQGGNTARQVSHYRPAVPIVAFTPDTRIYQRMSMFWGVTPLHFDEFEDDREFWDTIVPKALEQGIARPGETIILTGGHPFAHHGPTNFLKIMRV